jgi:insulysin
LQHDGWRIAQLSESTLNPAHPISRFSTGNNLTLRDEPKRQGYDIREELLKFYAASYSANLMKLCVVGRESLDQLQAWVEESFANVKNIGRERPSFLDIPIAIAREHTQTLTRIVPVKNYRQLEVEWIFPPTHHHYLADPTKLIVHCLAHEGEGSLAHYLKGKSYVNSLTAGTLEQNSSYSLGRIEMELTESGLLAIDEILEAVAAYTHMLKRSLDTQPGEWKNSIWPECRAVEKMEFRFAEKIDPVRSTAEHVRRSAANIHSCMCT